MKLPGFSYIKWHGCCCCRQATYHTGHKVTKYSIFEITLERQISNMLGLSLETCNAIPLIHIMQYVKNRLMYNV